MTDKELSYILAIAEERNVTRAAERLHLAQPSLTQTLRKIEEGLGCALFVRRKYGLDPTEAGKLYIEMARDILLRMQTFADDLSKLKNPLSGRLSIGASWYNTLLFLADIIPEVNRRFPMVELTLTEKGSNDLMTLFSEHALDLCLVHEYPKAHARGRRKLSKEMNRKKLIDEPFCVVAHRKFGLDSLACNGQIDLEKLKTCPFISFNPNQRIRKITDAAFEQAGVQTRKVVMTQSFPGALNLAERGVGLSVLPAFYVLRNLKKDADLSSYVIDPGWNAYWSAYVYYRSDASGELVKCVLAILETVAEELKKENAGSGGQGRETK